MPPRLKPFPTLKELVVREIVRCRSLFGKLYEQEQDLFDPVPSDIVDSILEEYYNLSEHQPICANELCMLITSGSTKLDLNRLRVHRHKIDYSLICDALGSRCGHSLQELKLSRWAFPASAIAFITLLCGCLQELDLSFGRTSDEHIEVLAENCPQLKKLNVQDEEQKISSHGLMKIAEARFQLESLSITGTVYSVKDIVYLLEKQKQLTHLRIANLIEALLVYARDVAAPLALTHLVLLYIGSNITNYPKYFDISSVLPLVTALEIDQSLLCSLMGDGTNSCFGLTKLRCFSDVKIRKVIGVYSDNFEKLKVVSSWNLFLSYPCFERITFLQLESGRQVVPFPKLSCLKNLKRLIIRNSIVDLVEAPYDVEGAQISGTPRDKVCLPEMPEYLMELIISEIRIGLPHRLLRDLLDQCKYLECLCLHFVANAVPVETLSKDFIYCLEGVLPNLVKLHVSCGKRWEIDNRLLEFILKCGSRLTDLQLNHLSMDGYDRQHWLDHVTSYYDIKFKLLE